MHMQAKAVTFEEFRRGGGGGGFDPSGGDGILATLFKKWAEKLLDKELKALDGQDVLTPEQHVRRQGLAREFDNVARSPLAAQRVVREMSAIPLIRYIV